MEGWQKHGDAVWIYRSGGDGGVGGRTDGRMDGRTDRWMMYRWMDGKQEEEEEADEAERSAG